MFGYFSLSILGLAVSANACRNAAPGASQPPRRQVPRADAVNSPVTPPLPDSPSRGVRYFMCGGDFSHLPTTDRVVVDLRLRSKNENRIPTDEDVRAVTALGGTVLHRFNVALIRVEIDAAALPRIVGDKSIGDYALTVPDLRVYDVPVQIYFTRAITEADRAALRRVGVSDIGQFLTRPILGATAPDRALPEIQRIPGVEFARAQALSCESDFKMQPKQVRAPT